jgi:hypothetical protein
MLAAEQAKVPANQDRQIDDARSSGMANIARAAAARSAASISRSIDN